MSSETEVAKYKGNRDLLAVYLERLGVEVETCCRCDVMDKEEEMAICECSYWCDSCADELIGCSNYEECKNSMCEECLFVCNVCTLAYCQECSERKLGYEGACHECFTAKKKRGPEPESKPRKK